MSQPIRSRRLERLSSSASLCPSYHELFFVLVWWEVWCCTTDKHTDTQRIKHWINFLFLLVLDATVNQLSTRTCFDSLLWWWQHEKTHKLVTVFEFFRVLSPIIKTFLGSLLNSINWFNCKSERSQLSCRQFWETPRNSTLYSLSQNVSNGKISSESRWPVKWSKRAVTEKQLKSTNEDLLIIIKLTVCCVWIVDDDVQHPKVVWCRFYRVPVAF